MNVLSLFDGISCGQLALQRSNIKVDNYYASEIEKNVIKVTKHHFPNTIQLGDVTNWQNWNIDWGSIDLLIGGSPCQSFSNAGKMEGFNGESGLFYKYLEILNHLKSINPNIKFLLENVVMKKEWQDIISNLVGVEPVLINSSLFSAQNRKRLYWCNWTVNVNEIKDKNILLKDIIEDGIYINKGGIRGRRINKNGHREDYNKIDTELIQCLEVAKNTVDKSNCLTTVIKDNVLSDLPSGRYIDAFGKYKNNWRYLSIKEYHRLQTLPEDYCCGIIPNTSILKAIGNGWTVDVISYLFNCLKGEL